MSKQGFQTGSRKIYILPTRFGLLFSASLLLMLLVSINYNNGLGHLFTFILAGIGVVSMHHTQRNLLDLNVEAHEGRAVFAGDNARFSVQLEDCKDKLRTSVWLRGGLEDQLFDILPGRKRIVESSFRPPGRGLHPLPGITLLSLYPLGLFCAWTREYVPSVTQLVYPKPAEYAALPPPNEGSREFDRRMPGQGTEDLHNIRDHQWEDPISHIHWRHSARGAGLKTKQFEVRSGSSVHLDWNQLTETDDEARISRLCRWVLDAESANLRYSLSLPGTDIHEGQGQRHMHDCLKTLALWEPV